MFSLIYFTNCVAAFVSLCKGLQDILGANFDPLQKCRSIFCGEIKRVSSLKIKVSEDDDSLSSPQAPPGLRNYFHSLKTSKIGTASSRD